MAQRGGGGCRATDGGVPQRRGTALAVIRPGAGGGAGLRQVPAGRGRAPIGTVASPVTTSPATSEAETDLCWLPTSTASWAAATRKTTTVTVPAFIGN